ncbi:MAG: DUF255 domain-containing protein, partial [Candidatus Hodarchaeales archaeon]
MSSKKGNQLSKETSPYLLQHANNPVDWHNWERGIQKAKSTQKPILISIGYAACHWCHVMEKESFEDAETADLMNKLFINIKRPLTVFATPEGLAFAGGTYFPKDPSYGLPGFKQVLTYIHEEYRKNPEKIRNLSTSTKTQLEKLYDFQSVIKIDKQIQNAFNIILGGMSERYDTIFGGFGFQPKFPQVTDLRMLLV